MNQIVFIKKRKKSALQSRLYLFGMSSVLGFIFELPIATSMETIKILQEEFGINI